MANGWMFARCRLEFMTECIVPEHDAIHLAHDLIVEKFGAVHERWDEPDMAKTRLLVATPSSGDLKTLWSKREFHCIEVANAFSDFITAELNEHQAAPLTGFQTEFKTSIVAAPCEKGTN